jgi:hypothetical protein
MYEGYNNESWIRIKQIWRKEMTDVMDINYGPLTGLIGTWEGDKGMDVAPEPDGIEENPYYETITFEAAGDVENAESQVLSIVRYHQVVKRKSNDEVFHDEIGYWLWDSSTDIIIHSFTIPRGVCVLAGGKAPAQYDPLDGITLSVASKLGDPDWGILQSPFMRDNASTLEFRHSITIKDKRLSYTETTVIDIYGNKTFEHTDNNELTLRD